MAMQFLPSDLRESLIDEHLLAEIYHSSSVGRVFIAQVSAGGNRVRAERDETSHRAYHVRDAKKGCPFSSESGSPRAARKNRPRL
jgi:hypothetical protein